MEANKVFDETVLTLRASERKTGDKSVDRQTSERKRMPSKAKNKDQKRKIRK
jgi:hypothetical protein